MPKSVGGAPLSPRNTWFHTPLVQVSMLLLRVKNCCWPALMTTPPLNSSSARNPPLTNPSLQKSWSDTLPLMVTRRIGAACDTAQYSNVLLQPGSSLVAGTKSLVDGADSGVKLRVRFESERQKLFSAVQKLFASHWFRT